MQDVPSSLAGYTRQLPIAWFSVVMGLGGLTIAWRRAEDLLALPFHPSPWLLGLSTSVFLLLTFFYGVRALRHREDVLQEWRHPVKMSFVPTLSIGLLLLAVAWLPVEPVYSRLLWVVGTGLHLLLTLYVLTQWMHQTHFEITHLNPAWFIPVVGNILVPIAGVSHAPADVSWFFFSVGMVFWPVLLAVIYYRVVFHGTLPERLMPTLFILIAPPAVGFLAYLRLTDQVDTFARLLFFSALFFTLLLFYQGRWFTRLRFALSWWAYSFPLAAVTLAALAMYQHTGAAMYLRLSGLLLGITSVVVTGLVGRTLLALKRGEFRAGD